MGQKKNVVKKFLISSLKRAIEKDVSYPAQDSKIAVQILYKGAGRDTCYKVLLLLVSFLQFQGGTGTVLYSK